MTRRGLEVPSQLVVPLPTEGGESAASNEGRFRAQVAAALRAVDREIDDILRRLNFPGGGLSVSWQDLEGESITFNLRLDREDINSPALLLGSTIADVSVANAGGAFSVTVGGGNVLSFGDDLTAAGVAAEAPAATSVLTRERGDARYALAGSGVTVHAALTGLEADDHPHYLTRLRADQFYAPVGSVVTSHGALTGLEADDHPQYLTEARGDVRYVDTEETAGQEIKSSLTVSRAFPYVELDETDSVDGIRTLLVQSVDNFSIRSTNGVWTTLDYTIGRDPVAQGPSSHSFRLGADVAVRFGDGVADFSLPIVATGWQGPFTAQNEPLDDVFFSFSVDTAGAGVDGTFSAWFLPSAPSINFRLNGVTSARVSPPGADLPATTTLVTREKGDARYLKLEGAREEFDIADDAVATISPGIEAGFVSVVVRSGTVANPGLSGVFYFDAGATPACYKMDGGALGASLDTSTGALTGTTGVDGNMTISAVGDGTVMIENRAGGTRNVRVSALSDWVA